MYAVCTFTNCSLSEKARAKVSYRKLIYAVILRLNACEIQVVFVQLQDGTVHANLISKSANESM